MRTLAILKDYRKSNSVESSKRQFGSVHNVFNSRSRYLRQLLEVLIEAATVLFLRIKFSLFQEMLPLVFSDSSQVELQMAKVVLAY